MEIISSLIFVFILAIIVVTTLLIIVGVKVQQNKGGEDVIKNVYIYLVLFATLMMTIGGSVAAFMAVADIMSPSPYYQSFEEFKNMDYKQNYDPERPEATAKETLSEEELKIRYDAMVASEKERAINRAKNSLIKSFGWIVIPLPIFIFFQRKLVQKNL